LKTHRCCSCLKGLSCWRERKPTSCCGIVIH